MFSAILKHLHTFYRWMLKQFCSSKNKSRLLQLWQKYSFVYTSKLVNYVSKSFQIITPTVCHFIIFKWMWFIKENKPQTTYLFTEFSSCCFSKSLWNYQLTKNMKCLFSNLFSYSLIHFKSSCSIYEFNNYWVLPRSGGMAKLGC